MDAPEIIDYYILFHNHTEGMALYQYIRAHGANARICPVPRTASACCGMSLLVLEEDIEAVRRCVPPATVEANLAAFGAGRDAALRGGAR